MVFLVQNEKVVEWLCYKWHQRQKMNKNKQFNLQTKIKNFPLSEPLVAWIWSIKWKIMALKCYLTRRDGGFYTNTGPSETFCTVEEDREWWLLQVLEVRATRKYTIHSRNWSWWQEGQNILPRSCRNWSLAQIRFNSVKTPSSLFRKKYIGVRETSHLKFKATIKFASSPSKEYRQADGELNLNRQTWPQCFRSKYTQTWIGNSFATNSCWACWNITRMFQI